jgi:hypothetical protein
MSTNEPGKQDDALGRLLAEWRITAPLPAHFQPEVWRRVEEAHAPAAPSVWPVLAHWIGAVMPRPALAASYLAILLTIGATAGWTRGRHETARVKSGLGERYIRVLDPYAVPRQ